METIKALFIYFLIWLVYKKRLARGVWPSVRSICTLKRTFITERQCCESPASSRRVWCRAGWSQGTGACPWVCVCVCVCGIGPTWCSIHDTLSHSLSGLRNRVRHTHKRTHTPHLQARRVCHTLSPGQPFNTTSVHVYDGRTELALAARDVRLVQDRRELSVSLRKWAAPRLGWERLKDVPSISLTRGLSLA